MATPLDAEPYISLETFKKDGSGVKTPVWCAPLDGGRLAVFSAGTAYKVKRVRRDPRFRAAGCDVRGKVHGAWHQGSARIVEDRAEIERMLAAFRRKYGWQDAVSVFFARLAGRLQRRAWIELTVDGVAAG
jgi:uncharacterized protein